MTRGHPRARSRVARPLTGNSRLCATADLSLLSGSTLTLMAALAYAILARLLVRHEGPGSLVAKAMGGELKIALSPVAYGAAIVMAFFFPPLSLALYAGVALCWLIPDPRIERAIAMK